MHTQQQIPQSDSVSGFITVGVTTKKIDNIRVDRIGRSRVSVLGQDFSWAMIKKLLSKSHIIQHFRVSAQQSIPTLVKIKVKPYPSYPVRCVSRPKRWNKRALEAPPLVATSAAATEGAVESEVNVLLAVNAHHEGGHVHNLLADPVVQERNQYWASCSAALFLHLFQISQKYYQNGDYWDISSK